MLPIISSSELRRIEVAIKMRHDSIETSLDLGKSQQTIQLNKEGFVLDSQTVKLPRIKSDEKCCYIVKDGALERVQYSSEETGFIYKLVPTSFRPILQTSGTPMHKQAFIERVEKDKLKGKVLDSGTGLGYTAIAAAKTARKVITIEIDYAIIEIARMNPYSQELFTDKKIILINADLMEDIKKYKESEFDNIILDVGNQRIYADFFSLANYKEAYRVLKKGGKLYHYIPQPQVTRGRDFIGEVSKRIKLAGFVSVERNSEDSYIVATK